jgi:phospholipid/cholesterol/gamma-HCH transport system permease protein
MSEQPPPPKDTPTEAPPRPSPYSTRGDVSLVPVVVAQGTEDFFHRIGRQTREAIAYLGGISRLSWDFTKVFYKPPIGARELVAQCEAIGMKSMPIATLILFFVGLVFALQFGLTLQTMGAVPYLGKITSLSIVRELGPVFTALVVGSRVGAGMAAEIGSMRVTEQVDAIRALGADPVKKLVVPRVLATTLMLPLVSLFADIVGIIGGMLISYLQFDLSMVHFYKSAVTTVHATDFLSGYLKPFFFGFGIAIIGCYEGLTCGQGTEGVGKATTRTVVNVAVMVVLVDFFLTKLFTLLPRI